MKLENVINIINQTYIYISFLYLFFIIHNTFHIKKKKKKHIYDSPNRTTPPDL